MLLTCYLDQNHGADCVRWLRPARVISSICLCSKADTENQAHVGVDGGNIDEGNSVLEDKNTSYCLSDFLKSNITPG